MDFGTKEVAKLGLVFQHSNNHIGIVSTIR